MAAALCRALSVGTPLALAATLCVGVSAHAGAATAAATSVCGVRPYGLIGARFLVRWTSAADRAGTQRDIGGGTSGRMRVRVMTTSGYRFIVEGCDTGTFSSSCEQGWTLSVTA